MDGGDVLFSCTEVSGVCTQILLPPGAVGTYTSQCSMSGLGTPGTGCSTVGLVGCCVQPPGNLTSCAYNAPVAMSIQMDCKSPGVWQTSL